MVVARELTKLYEELQRGTPAELLAHFTEQPPRGEITLVIGGATEAETEVWDDERVREALAERLAAGESASAAARAVAKESGRPRREVYRMVIGD